MSADSDRLDELAGSVLDGLPVDWAGADSNALDESEHLRVAVLQEVSRIAEFHRELQRARRARASTGFHGELRPLDRCPGLPALPLPLGPPRSAGARRPGQLW